MKHVFFVIIIIGLCFTKANAQNIELFQQFNGRYDYIAIGNTLNQAENNLSQFFCETLPSSQANLTLPNNTNIVAAYLFWSGSGTGDNQVTLNTTSINAQDTFTVDYNAGSNGLLTYFASYAEVTDQINNEGSTNYIFSDLDISDTLTNTPGYCNNRTNYAGWSLYVIYEQPTLPLNQVNLFLGLEIINADVQDKTIILENVNVLDNNNAKIGFLAWEGDNALNFGESLSINGNVLSNPPLNLPDNAFNGTNSFTNSTNFYNADLDVYNIENNIQIGDTEVTINLTTGDFDSNGIFRADLIILNNIITVLNSQLPDATVTQNFYQTNCNTRSITIDYTVYNNNSTAALPTNTAIAFFIDNVLIGQSQTNTIIGIGEEETSQITLEIPNTIPDTFIIEIEVDNDGNNNGLVTETNEVNNNTFSTIQLIPIPETIQLAELVACDQGYNTGIYNLNNALINIDLNLYQDLFFYSSLDDLNNQDAITNPSHYISNTTPQTIYVAAQTQLCFDLFVFTLNTTNCPPTIPDGFSPNQDTINDYFNIQGLYNVFQDHELLIYNRYGTLIFIGNNNTKWYGQVNQGLTNQGNIVPTGTYFYVLNLKAPNYQIQTGWVYINY